MRKHLETVIRFSAGKTITLSAEWVLFISTSIRRLIFPSSEPKSRVAEGRLRNSLWTETPRSSSRSFGQLPRTLSITIPSLEPPLVACILPIRKLSMIRSNESVRLRRPAHPLPPPLFSTQPNGRTTCARPTLSRCDAPPEQVGSASRSSLHNVVIVPIQPFRVLIAFKRTSQSGKSDDVVGLGLGRPMFRH